MKYRKLRIAFSAVCGIVCLLLIVLWVRSYWRYQTIGNQNGVVVAAVIESWDGRIWFFWKEHALSTKWHLVRLPHWFPAMVFAGLGTAPWLRWRFSLRTLLIGMTLVAALLGAAVWAVR